MEEAIGRFLTKNRPTMDAEVERWLEKAAAEGRSITREAVEASVRGRWRARAELMIISLRQARAMKERAPQAAHQTIESAFISAGTALCDSLLGPAAPWTNPRWDRNSREQLAAESLELALATLRAELTPTDDPMEKYLLMCKVQIDREVDEWVTRAREGGRSITRAAIQASVERRFRALGAIPPLVADLAFKDTLVQGMKNGEQVLEVYNELAKDLLTSLEKGELAPRPPWEEPTYTIDLERVKSELRSKAWDRLPTPR